MNIEYLKKYCIEKIKKYPSIKSEIREIYHLAMCEIKEGESETNEVNLAINDIDELIKELEDYYGY